jgi:hypothetical protein
MPISKAVREARAGLIPESDWTEKEKQAVSRAKQARLLRSAASALEHGRLQTASKKIEQALGGPLVIFVEGGLVQDVGRVNAEGFLAVEHDIVDYDILDGTPDIEVKEYFERRSPETIAYMRQFLPDEYEKFQERIREVEANDIADAATRKVLG